MTALLKSAVPEPRPDDWVFDPQGVSEVRRATVPRYGDAIWSLLGLNKNPSAGGDLIRWSWFPDQFARPFRHAAYALINYPLPDCYLHLHGAPMRSSLSTGRLFKTVHQWGMFASWLARRGISSLAAVTEEDLVDYTVYLAKDRGVARNTAEGHLIALARLYYYSTDYLPADCRTAEPPWITQGLDDFVPAATPRGENATEPITPATMGPLLVWALRFVELFADDILAAAAERARLVETANTATGRHSHTDSERVTAFLEQLERAGAPMPTLAREKVVSFALQYICGTTGASMSQARYITDQPHWRAYAARHHAPAKLDTPIAGQLDGTAWRGPIGFDETRTLTKHLVVACFIVISYLTGMRPGEVLALEAGCCPAPAEGSARNLIYGREFKPARDEDGNHDSAGTPRDVPWVAIPQAVSAIRVMERIVGSGMLFDAEQHDPRSPESRSGRSLHATTMANRIESFVAFVNGYCERHDRRGEAIPPDPGGFIGTGRFRRTLAWHIARRPGGLVALAIQYGHMRTIISESYASRSRDGIHELLDYETARDIAERLAEVHDSLEAGEAVSGPAARRLIDAAHRGHHRFGGIVTTTRQATALLSDPTLSVFENTGSFLMCTYDRSKALCDPGRGGRTTAPSLDRCRSSCANIARTDAQARAMRAEAGRLTAQAESAAVPAPIAERLGERARELERLAADHERDRATGSEDLGQ